ncbi:hypothetical protein LENED_003812 [Lentinula edodes]|uniref:Uncharacterized protein n=1 Tax=Lentinula edodes TaxID=5353 RepID=A0A1Q3E4T2_LENED|nr:hypothetical protein LENED_003812 [Lentinula edodes]
MTHMDRQASTSPIVSVPSFDSLLPPVDIIPLRVPLSPLFLYTQLRAMNSHSQYRLDDHRDGLNDAGFPPESAFIVYRKSISSGERNKELKITYFAEYEAFFNILQGQPWSSQQQLSEIRLLEISLRTVPIHTLIISFAKNSLVNFLWGFFNKFFYIDVFSTALSWHG